MANKARRTMSSAIDELGTKAFSSLGLHSSIFVRLCFVCKEKSCFFRQRERITINLKLGDPVQAVF
jgi:hypothetical protein